MEHQIPAMHFPIRRTIENLLSFPSVVLADTARSKAHKSRTLSQMELQEKEESLTRLQSALTARSAELHRKEQALSERWDTGRIYTLPVGAITANPHQPRQQFEELSLFSLSNSIREHGILQPLTVRRTQHDTTASDAASNGDGEDTPAEPLLEDAKYELICGERRLRAAIAIGMKTVPCIILDADNRRAAELALIENLQRENLNPFEQAGAIAALIDMHAMTQEEIARALSVSQSYVANKLRILRLTSDEREVILSSHMTERHARAFLRIRDLDLRRKTVRAAARAGWNVARTEQYIDTLLTANPMPPRPLRTVPDPPPAAQTPSKKCILKDLRLFFNTVDRALAAVREAGFSAEYETRESAVGVTVTLSICERKPSENVSRETDKPTEITNIR